MKNNSFFGGFSHILFYLIFFLSAVSFSPFFNPQTWTKMIVFKAILVILFGILLYQLFFKHKSINITSIKKHPLFLALGVFLIVFFLASLFSINPYTSFFGDPERGGGFINLAFFSIFTAVTFLTFDETTWKKMWNIAIGTGAFVAFLSVIAFYGFLPSLLGEISSRKGATIGNPIPYGIFLVLILFMTLVFFLKEQHKKRKIFYGISGLLMLFALLLSGSRAAYFGFLIGVFFFLFFYPKAADDQEWLKKYKGPLRIAGFVIISLAFALVLFATYAPQSTLQQISRTKTLETVLPRLSLKSLAGEERFKSWQTTIKAIEERPMLGWGPENLSVGFDKHFDPMTTPLGWWDRAHNIYLDTADAAGFLGLLAYLGIFITLFWQTSIMKKAAEGEEIKLFIHGIQATLIAYIVSNFFSIESFETLLLFFFILSYTAYLTKKPLLQEAKRPFTLHQGQKKVIFATFIILTGIFLWFFDLNPFLTNSQLNVANAMATQNSCKDALNRIDGLQLPQKMLGQYGILQAEQAIGSCVKSNPTEATDDSKKGLDLLEKSLPLYQTANRLWVLAGDMASTIAAPSQDQQEKETYIKKAYQYYKKALSLSPKSQEILLKIADLDILSKDCQAALEKANQCLALNPGYAGCYWSRAQANICNRNFTQAEVDIATAKSMKFDIGYEPYIKQAINAYLAAGNYEKVAESYQFLVDEYYNHFNLQYRASLAEAYRLSHQYDKARATALDILKILATNDPGLQLKPGEKESVQQSVEAFLQSLPK